MQGIEGLTAKAAEASAQRDAVQASLREPDWEMFTVYARGR